MAKQFENSNFPMAQRDEEEKAEDLSVKAVEEDLSAGVAQLAAARVVAEMRESAAIRKFIAGMDTFGALSSGDPARVDEWLEHVTKNPMAYCQRMSTRHHM